MQAVHKLLFQTVRGIPTFVHFQETYPMDPKAQGTVPIELFSGGAKAVLQLPDVTTVPIIEIDSG